MFFSSYGVEFFVLLSLFLVSGFFSMAETSMMTANRYRLEALSEKGHRGAITALRLLDQIDSFIGTILLGNNLANAAVTTIMTQMSLAVFDQKGLMLGFATALSAFLILVFSEVIPKIIGSRFANPISIRISFFVYLIFKLFFPLVYLTKWMSTGILSLFQFNFFQKRFQESSNKKSQRLAVGELRLFLMEYSHLIVSEHRKMLLNLASLQDVVVEDLMVPRSAIEGIDISESIENILEKITTAHHSRILVYADDYQEIIGILPIKRVLGVLRDTEVTFEKIRALVSKVLFVPSNNSAIEQLQFFIEHQERFAVVVDEYGEVQGIITVDDIIDDVVGKLNVNPTFVGQPVVWDSQNSVIVEGSARLRELNRCLSVSFPLNGPKTLNGWILSQLTDLPEGDVAVRVGDVVVETVQISDRCIRLARLRRILK